MEKVDELKSKFLDLIHGNSKVPVVGHLPDYSQFLQDNAAVESTVNQHSSDRPSDQEILETIDQIYFSSDKDFDAGRYELGKIDDMTKIEKIEEYLQQLKQQQLVVSNNVLQIILEKQSACQEEFKNVVDVERYVDGALDNVRESRSKLEIATKLFTTASLGILANYRRRTLVQQLLRYLKTIKTMHETESRMPDLFNSGDFSGAIDLLLECQRVAAKYRHFTCIDALSSKLQDTLVMAEEHLDGALSAMCHEFDEMVYKKLQSAYTLLGKTEVAIDQLHMYFFSAVQKKSSYVVQSYTIIEATSSNDKKKYTEVCKEIPQEHFIPCLLTLCKTLWKIILSYHQVVAWHLKNPIENIGDGDFEANYNEQYVRNKLNNGLAKLWQDVQTKVSSLFLAANIANIDDYKIDDFLEVLSILHRFSQIGEELCDSESKEVAVSVRSQSICYFNKFHINKLDELKVILENETWTPCPVRKDFSLLLLQEFRGLRSSLEQSAGVSGRHNSSSIDGSSTGANFFNRFPDPKGPTPFDISFHPDMRDEHIMTNDDSPGYYSEESEDDTCPVSVSVDKNMKDEEMSIEEHGPLLANTTLSVLRLCGKYLQMSRLLKSISIEVVLALTQLFEYYLYTVYTFFASDIPDSLCPSVSSLKLISVMKRINESLFQKKDQDLYVTLYKPLLSCMENPDTLYVLKERIVAVESLTFLAKEFGFLKSYLEQLLESQGSPIHYLQQFYGQTVSVALEMRKPVYACVAWRSIDCKQVLGMMSKVDWEVKDLMTEHSKYIDFVFLEFQSFMKGLSEINSIIHIPESSIEALWECLVMLVAYLFVEGFSTSKKCSGGGRALMQLDLTQYITKLEKICPLRPIPYRDFVETYIKAYYLVEDDLENWIKEHGEYSTKQLLSLVSCTCQSNRKMRQKLTAFIEDLEKKDVR